MKKIGLVVFLSRWLELRGIGLNQLDDRQIAEFIKSEHEALSHRAQVNRTISQFFEHLRRLHVIAPQLNEQVLTKMDQSLAEYGRFLREERGLSERSLENYLPIVRRFLSHSFGSGEMRLEKLSASNIHDFYP